MTSDAYEQKASQILNDVRQRCHELNSRITPAMMRGYWDMLQDEYTIENYLFYRTYQISSDVMTDMTRQGHARYVNYIDSIAKYLAYDSSKSEQVHGMISKETNEMFKKLSDTEYENTVATITDEYEDKKRDAQAEYNEKLAKAEAEKVTANIREEADLWAYDLYARYNALHESGFAEELSIELLKLYISSKK